MNAFEVVLRSPLWMHATAVLVLATLIYLLHRRSRGDDAD